MQTRDWLVIGGVAGAGSYSPATDGPVGSFTSGIRASYEGAGPAGPQWRDINVSVSGNTYTVQATYVGPGTPTPAGLTVTKIG